MPKLNLYKNQDFGPEAKTLSQENKEEESQIFSEVTWVIKKTETFFLKKVRNKMLSFQPRLELFVTLELAAMEKSCRASICYSCGSFSKGINAYVILMTSCEISRCYIRAEEQQVLTGNLSPAKDIACTK